MKVTFYWTTYRLHWVDGYHLFRDPTGEVVPAHTRPPLSPYLVRQDDWVEPRAVREYPPENDFALHQSFASLACNCESILAWAQEYGLLTHGAIFENPAQPGNSCQGIEVRNCYQGETLEFWADEIQAMRFTLALWGLSSQNTPESFERLGHFIGKAPDFDQLYLRNQPRLRRLGPAEQVLLRNPHTDDCFRRGTLSVAARHYVCKLLNNYLKNRVSPIVAASNELLLPAYMPRDLIGALWLQVHTVVTQNISLKHCQLCGTPFKAGPGTGRRIDATYCSGNRCRAKGWRQRGRQR